jgi:transposase
MVVGSVPSRAVSSVVREPGVDEAALGCWVLACRGKLAGEPIPDGTPDGGRAGQLGRRDGDLEMGLAFLKKAASYFARERRWARGASSPSPGAPFLPRVRLLPPSCWGAGGLGCRSQGCVDGGRGGKAWRRGARAAGGKGLGAVLRE